jgi:hypothetical protein
MRGRPVLGVFAGFFFGLFLGVTLVLIGVLPLNSWLVTAMPFIGVVYGLLMARFAPFSRRGEAAP